jgi:hypothetical protein
MDCGRKATGASYGQAQNADPEGEKGNREAHGQGCKETSRSICKGQKEKIRGGIWPIERGDDRCRSQGGK